MALILRIENMLRIGIILSIIVTLATELSSAFFTGITTFVPVMDVNVKWNEEVDTSPPSKKKTKPPKKGKFLMGRVPGGVLVPAPVHHAPTMRYFNPFNPIHVILGSAALLGRLSERALGIHHLRRHILPPFLRGSLAPNFPPMMHPHHPHVQAIPLPAHLMPFAAESALYLASRPTPPTADSEENEVEVVESAATKKDKKKKKATKKIGKRSLVVTNNCADGGGGGGCTERTPSVEQSPIVVYHRHRRDTGVVGGESVPFTNDNNNADNDDSRWSSGFWIFGKPVQSGWVRIGD